MISVIIPAGPNEKIENINRTIDSLRSNASSVLEFIVVADGWEPKGVDSQARIHSFATNKGERETLNKGVELANGSHVLRIDAHCSMSNDWDVEFLKHCKDNTICVSTLDALDETTWEGRGHAYRFVYININGEEKWWGGYKENKDVDAEPTMSFTGCGWLCNRDFYLNHLYSDVSLSKWGSIGPEMSLRTEKAGGSVLLCKKVKCGHVFTTNPKGYPVSEVAKTRLKLLAKYAKYLYAAAKRFNAPGWENITEDYIVNYRNYFMYETTIDRKETTETRDSSGNVIKKVIKYYQPVPYKGAENPDDPEVGKRLTQDAPVVQIRIADWGVQGWHYTTLNKKEDIELWLFENAPV